ncbi:hypothetical protein ACH4SP_36500 [Streptomyces sp. NPDC021093]|uniref:hypothetical protein n=1 Tax=Streptomyces sp. NPDC021093 TaxID=3365112 RepID=UPI003791EF7F
MRTHTRVRVRSAVFAAVLGSLSLFGTGATPAVADSSTPLPIGSYRDMAVDGAHQRVFLTDPFGGTVLVTDYTGQVVKRIGNEAGAWGVALSPDSATLYVALRDAGAISVIDTATLEERARYDTGTGSGAYAGPTSLALAGGKLWFGYSLDTWRGALGSVDLSAADPVVTRGEGLDTFRGSPHLAAAPRDPDTLVAAESDGNSATLAVYDVSSGRTSEQARRTAPGPDGCASLQDLALTPDGSRVVVACASPYYHQAFRTSDLSDDGRYTTDSYPNSVAVAPDGTIAAGSSSLDKDVWVYRPGGNTPLKSLDTGTEQTATGGLAWAPDRSRLFSVTGDYNFGPLSLKVVDDPAVRQSTLGLQGPASARKGSQVTLTGSLAPADGLAAGTTVSVKRYDAAAPDGVLLAPVPVGADGTFSFTDRPGTVGTVRYAAEFAGDGWLTPATGETSFPVTRR